MRPRTRFPLAPYSARRPRLQHDATSRVIASDPASWVFFGIGMLSAALAIVGTSFPVSRNRFPSRIRLFFGHPTLDAMFHYNMGGGIPYDVITALMRELDSLGCPLPTRAGAGS